MMNLRRIFLRFLCPHALLIFIILLGTGCSTLQLRKGTEPGTGWACDRKAYEAMKTDNYETDIFLYQNVL